MSTTSSTIVQRLWNYCNVLRDDGLSYGDYVEQLTYLLFLKMADEQTSASSASPARSPPASTGRACWRWTATRWRPTTATSSTELGKGGGLLRAIFRKAQNKIQDPAKLRRLIDLIDGETWIGARRRRQGRRLRGPAGEERRRTPSPAPASTSRRAPLIQAIVDVMQPQPGETICDPACGTGGFLLAAHDYIAQPPHARPATRSSTCSHEALHGWEIVDSTARLCAMNLLLHGIGARTAATARSAWPTASPADPGDRFDMVLTNPPFGKKSSVTFVNDDGEARARVADHRPRRLLGLHLATSSSTSSSTSRRILKINGRAAVVVPDNVLFEGGAGETVRRKLLHECDVHTLLRLPTGIFYAQGVKANVLFFDRKPGQRDAVDQASSGSTTCAPTSTSRLKPNPLTRADLDEFVALLQPRQPPRAHADLVAERHPTGRWRAFALRRAARPRQGQPRHLLAAGREPGGLAPTCPTPDVLAAEIVEDLQAALEQFEAILGDGVGNETRDAIG